METRYIQSCNTRTTPGPHSLGQSVEWKRDFDDRKSSVSGGGPTRWGNQLNGNFTCTKSCGGGLRGPTRWGNQLNGNWLTTDGNTAANIGPTRWGNQLNGNPKFLWVFSGVPVTAPLAGAIS